MNIAYFCSKASIWLRTYILRGTESRLSLVEMITGRAYYFVVMREMHGQVRGPWFMCSTIFATRQGALRHAKKTCPDKSCYRIVMKRRWAAYNRVISSQDVLAGNYRRSYHEQIKSLRHEKKEL